MKSPGHNAGVCLAALAQAMPLPLQGHCRPPARAVGISPACCGQLFPAGSRFSFSGFSCTKEKEATITHVLPPSFSINGGKIGR